MLPIRGWQIGRQASLSDGTRHSLQAEKCSGVPLYSTDLNSPSEPVDIGRDPSFSFYIRPAAILRVNSVFTPLLYGLRDKGKTNTGIVKSSFYFVCCKVPIEEDIVVPWGERGWCSMWMWSWSFSEGLQSSPQWCRLSWPCVSEGSAPSTEALD